MKIRDAIRVLLAITIAGSLTAASSISTQDVDEAPPAPFAEPVASPEDALVHATAFIDLNGDGQRQPGEQAFTDYEVHAYDDHGTAVPGILDPETNTFEIDTSSLTTPAEGAPRWRVEFTNPAEPYLPGAGGNDSNPDLGQARSDLQFVHTRETAIWAVSDPSAYCHDNPFLATSCYVNGDQLTDANRDVDALVTVGANWGSGGNSANVADYQVPQKGVKVSVANEIGSTWGEAWDPVERYLYVGSFLKMAAGFGPEGPNAIYRVPMDPFTGQASGPVELFARVGTSNGYDPDAGTFNKTFAATGNTDAVTVCDDVHGDDLTRPTVSDEVFANVGKCAFGDLEMSDDGSTLYAVSLAGREVLAFDTASGNLTNQFPVPVEDTSATCPDPSIDTWPFALGVNGGRVFVGSVCGALSTLDDADTHAYVHTLDTESGDWNQIFDMDLETHRKTNSHWVDTYANLRHDVDDHGLFAADASTKLPIADGAFGQFFRSRLMLTDIEFYGDDLTLGFRSRTGDQFGYFWPDPLDPDTSDTEFVNATAPGDLVCVWWDGSAYQLESNQSCGPDRAVDPALGAFDGGSGPGDGDWPHQEFLWGDGANFAHPGGVHREGAFGGLAQVNSGPLSFTGVNPPDALGSRLFNTGGIGWLNPLDGSPTRAFLLYQSDDRPDVVPDPFFAKGNGLGDLEHLCLLAPLEIGNYVWLDFDRDGVQDPSETPVDGVLISLYDADGNLLATDITEHGGHFVFNSAGPDRLPGNEDDIFAAGQQVRLKADRASDYEPGGPLDGWNLTEKDSTDGEAGSKNDKRDSDGVVSADQQQASQVTEGLNEPRVLGLVQVADDVGSFPAIVHTAGAVGSFDHSLDLGFVRSADQTTTTTNTTTTATTLTTSTSTTVPSSTTSTTVPSTTTSVPPTATTITSTTLKPPLARTGSEGGLLALAGGATVMLGMTFIGTGRRNLSVD